MFTGLIERVGEVASIEPSAAGRRLVINPGTWEYEPEHGASIAVSGCCLTHAPQPGEAGGLLYFDVIHQTLDCTTLGGLRVGSRVNLEACLTPASRLGGHFVQGHVDGTGRVEWITRDDGYRVRIGVGPELIRYIVPRGSIAIDGVSLTVADVDVKGETFEVALIPTTLALTTLDALELGSHVNLEVDMLAKTVVHYLENIAPPRPSA